MDGVADGTFTQATYLARWTQFLDYVQSLGLYVYPCGGDLGHWGTATDGTASTLYQAWGALVDTYPNVVGIDVTNELLTTQRDAAARTRASRLTTAAALTSALRSVTSLPLAHSRVVQSDGDWDTRDFADLLDIGDFIDAHLFYTPGVNGPAALQNHPWRSTPVVVGEFGVNMVSSSADRIARYAAVKAMLAGHGQMLGGLAWAASDQGAAAADQFGLVSRAGAVRSDIADVFQALPTAR